MHDKSKDHAAILIAERRIAIEQANIMAAKARLNK